MICQSNAQRPLSTKDTASVATGNELHNEVNAFGAVMAGKENYHEPRKWANDCDHKISDSIILLQVPRVQRPLIH